MRKKILRIEDLQAEWIYDTSDKKQAERKVLLREILLSQRESKIERNLCLPERRFTINDNVEQVD